MNSRVYKVLVIIALAAALWSNVRAQEAMVMSIPTTLNYQGYLREPDGSLTTGVYTITANVYNEAAGSAAPLYTTVLPNVTVRDGLFNVVLGDDPALPASVFASSPLYIGITINEQPELIPRQRLHAVPWAFQSSTLVNNATIYGFTSDGGTTVNGDALVNGNQSVSGSSTVGGNAYASNLYTWNETANSYAAPGIYFLPSKVEVKAHTSTCAVTGWTTFNASAHIPADATAVILEGFGAISNPDSAIWSSTASIAIRPSPSVPNGYYLVRAAAASNGDNIVVGGQGIFPLSGTSFQYAILDNGFNGGCDIYLVGYVR